MPIFTDVHDAWENYSSWPSQLINLSWHASRKISYTCLKNLQILFFFLIKAIFNAWFALRVKGAHLESLCCFQICNYYYKRIIEKYLHTWQLNKHTQIMNRSYQKRKWMIGHIEKTKLKYQNRHEKYILKTKQPFSYRKHNAIHFQVNVQRRQTAFHSEHQNLGSAENNTCVAKRTGWWRTTIFF